MPFQPHRTAHTLLLGLVLAAAMAVFPAGASAAAEPCPASGTSGDVTLNTPSDGATLTGDTTVEATPSSALSAQGVQRLVFCVDGEYTLTDYEAPYRFSLPTDRWADGDHQIQVQAMLRSGSYSLRTAATVTFSNGVTTPPGNTRQWPGPASGTPPAPGEPFVVAAAGDGAGGELGAQTVVNRIQSWSSNMFLYLGDVYEKGAPTEFKNWYGGPTTFFGQLRSITNPVVGNHEYSSSPTAAGYFDYWDNIPHYYSYNTHGWHFIALDSTSQYAQTAGWGDQYQFLVDDLAQHQGECTIAYWHHPIFNVGEEAPAERMRPIWQLLANNHVAIVLNGHDHDYQRWVPMDGSGVEAPDGITEFVVGTGGHSEQNIKAQDPRVVDTFDAQFGALRMELNSSGAAYQFITAAGMQLDSGSVQCPGTPADTAAPTAPTGLDAAAHSYAQVDLSWDASTDNVGVTGYDIYRNGTFLKTVGPETTAHDGTVAPDTTYTYTIKARDTAGNTSSASASTVATTQGLGVLFSDGFENSDFTTKWGPGSNHGMLRATDQVFSGSGSAEMVNQGGFARWISKQIATGPMELYYQTRVFVKSQGTTSPIDLMRFRSTAHTNPELLSVMRTAAGKLTVRNETTGVTVTGSGLPALPPGEWHTIQAHVLINGAASHVDVSLDGNPIQALSLAQNLGTTAIGGIDLGEPTPSANRVYDVYFDEVAVDTHPIPDVTPPTTPTSVRATSSSGLEVDLTWGKSQDDSSVTAYDVYRNGELIASPSVLSLPDPAHPSFNDTTVTDQISYFYQVRARDGAGNASDLSDLANITTPPVFSDGFESGGITQWDGGGTGLTPEPGSSFSGSYAARANVIGSAAYAKKNLPASRNDLYYRLRFRIDSQGASTPVTLLRFRTAADKSLYSLFIDNTSRTLNARNDNTGITSQSAVTIAQGQWYEVQVHLLVQGATSQVDVWVRGQPVSELSKVDNFGTTGIGKVELGDNMQHTFSALFDDVLVAGNFIEDDAPPSAPGGLAASFVASDQVTLSWASSVDNVAMTSYDVYRDGLLIRNVDASTTTFTDTSVEPGRSYRYEVRANDDEGNTSDASNSVQVTAPLPDGAPPTKPTSLTASAVSANEVDLAWAAATDDVGVTAYRIYRNGTLMKTVGGAVTSYADKATSGDNTYSYTLEAADAAGNLSGQSDAASATTPHSAFFADDFENGLGKWTVAGVVTASPGDTGTWAARARATGSSAVWAWATIPSAQNPKPQTELTYRTRFKLASFSGNPAVLKMRSTATGAPPILTVQLSSAGKLAVRNDVVSPAAVTQSQTPVSPNNWYTLEAHLAVAGAQSSYWVKLDGALVPGLSGTANFGTAPVGRIQFGDNSTNKTYDFYFDNIEVQVPTIPPANSSRPTITGTPVDQETLTAAAGGWTGTTQDTAYVYQWRDCDPPGSPCTDIPGANSNTYALRPTDIGKQIVVAVTATNAAGSATASSSPTAAVAAAAPRNLSPPTIAGAPVDGQPLAADHGSWRGSPTIDYAYQWQRCSSNGSNCTDITSATDSTYTLGSSDVGKTIDVVVTASNGGGWDQATSAATNVVGGVAPQNTAAPTISGTTGDGQTLTATTGSWGGTVPITHTFQWRRCDSAGANCADIGSATAAAYTLTSDDVGSRILVKVTATNAGGSASAQSAATAAIQPVAPANTSTPSISGTARDGQTLSAVHGDWSGTTPIAYAYQWRRCDSNGANCTDIGSATGSDYALATQDVGSTIAVRVTATNSGGTASAISAATGVVTGAGPVNTTAPSITGAPTDGQQLSGSQGSWSGTQPINYKYQWQRCDASGANCSNVSGATNATYTLQGADIGSTVRLVVSASNATGSAAAPSAATNQVAAAAPANTTAPSISGTTQDGQTLTLHRGAWTGSDTINYAYRWQRCAADASNCSDIASATGLQYTLTSDDVGSRILATVTATNSAGSASASAPTTSIVAGVAPANTTAPSILGAAIDGQTLTADKGSWSGSTPIQYGYQWRDCDSTGQVCTDISGATGGSYVLRSSDVNKRIVVRVTATNSTGSTSASSNATAAVSPVAPVNGVAPTVSGTPKVGSTLTADDGTWSGTQPINLTRQWQRCASDGTACSNIAGATGTTYVLVGTDVGQVLNVVVTASNLGGATTARSAKTPPIQPADVPPANVTAPTVSGTAQDGQTLTAGQGTWTGTAPIHYAYQWRDCDSGGSNCNNIAGATSGTYALQSSDVGASIRVAVTGSNDSGSVEARSAATSVVSPTPPANTTPPTISGNAKVGSTLSGDKGAWSGTTPINYGYQWQRCDADGTNCSGIGGATATSYTLQQADFGHRLQLLVTGTNTTGASSATSAATDPVVAAPWNTTAPSISGTAMDGSTLTADRGVWSGTDGITYAYQWQRCAADGTSCSDLAGETGSNYVLRGADVGNSVRVVVTATNPVGSNTAPSAAGNTVAAAPPSNTTPPSISGTMREGSTLTADKGVWSGTNPITYGYQWRRCGSDGTGCFDVAGATGTTYVLSTADSGKAVKVRATATNTAGSISADSTNAVLRAPVFSDGFEAGLGFWTGGPSSPVNLVAQQANAFAGSWSAHIYSTAGTVSYAVAPLPAPQTDLTYRLRFKNNSANWPPTGVYLLKFRTASTSVVGVYVDKNGKLAYKTDFNSGNAVSSGTTVTSNGWHEVSAHVTIAGTSSSIDLSLDGARVAAAPGTPAFPRTENFGPTAISKIQLGDNSTGRNFDVSADEAIVETGG